MNDYYQHTKSVSSDKRSRKRLRFQSSKQRSQQASADVYRRKDRIETTDETTSVAEELEIVLDRNASQQFKEFHNNLWYKVRSLPEVLHHLPEIVQLLMEQVLSKEEESKKESGEKSEAMDKDNEGDEDTKETGEDNEAPVENDKPPEAAPPSKAKWNVNLCTLDVLHLTGVLTRNARHEMVPHIDTIVTKLFQVLDISLLDVTFSEAVLRTWARVLQYTAEKLLEEDPTLDRMRTWYGPTLGHTQPAIRRLSAQAFATLLRRAKTVKHMKRVCKALDAAPASKTKDQATSGIALLVFHIVKGVQGQLHSHGAKTLESFLQLSVGYGVQLELMQLLMDHMKEMNEVWSIVIRVIEDREGPQLCHMMELLQQVIEYHDYKTLRKGDGRRLEDMLQLFQGWLPSYAEQPASNRDRMLKLLCSVWRAVPDRSVLSRRLEVPVTSLLTLDTDPSPLRILLRDLLPYLCPEQSMPSLGSWILKVAAQSKNAVDVVQMLFVFRSRLPTDDDTDSVCFYGRAKLCCVDSDTREQLIKVCHQVLAGTRLEEDESQVTACIHALTFVTLASDDDEDISKESPWAATTAEKVQSVVANIALSETTPSSTMVLLATAVEAISMLAKESASCRACRKSISVCQERVWLALKRKSSSLNLLRSAALCFITCKSLDVSIDVDREQAFELLSSNLRDRNHFRRLYSLRVLSVFPNKPFVMDQRDVDLSEDLDEEPSEMNAPSESSTKTAPVGLCTVMETLLAIEESPVGFQQERFLTSMVSRVEVFGRTGRLPVSYAEAASNHMLGVLWIKFSPVWKPAVKALVALAKNHEESMWPEMISLLGNLMKEPPCRGEGTEEFEEKEAAIDMPSFFVSVCSYEELEGLHCQMFSYDILSADSIGRPSRHKCTDEAVVLESLWSILQEYPGLFQLKSRSVVPLIVNFLHYHYFSTTSTDPDAAECQLGDHLDAENAWTVESKDTQLVHRRLVSILKALSAINGPQQLYKHEPLRRVIFVLSGNADTAIAQLAFSCLLKYKPKHVLPYAQPIQDLFDKKQFQDALLQFRTLQEKGKILEDDRQDLFATLSRVLFGRFVTRDSVGGGRMDSSARRTAIASMLASVYKSNDEIESFLGLVTRPYASLVESDPFVPAVQVNVPLQVHQGFLNGLDAIFSQFGQRIEFLVPKLLKIILAISNKYRISEIGMSDSREAVQRDGQIRSLCFRRLTDVLELAEHNPSIVEAIKELWNIAKYAIEKLPVMARSSPKPPSLLQLIAGISGHSYLHETLDEVAESAFSCLDSKCPESTLSMCLDIIQNLLLRDEAQVGTSRGEEVLKRHLACLLDRFKDRLRSLRSSSTWRRELSILCNISEVISQVPGSIQVEEAEHMTELLLPFIGHGSRCSDTDKMNVLKIMKVFATLLPKEGTDKLVGHLSKVLGPYKATLGVSSKPLRVLVSDTFQAMAQSSNPDILRVSRLLVDLSAMNSKKVDEIDVDTVILTLSKLCEDSFWLDLCCCRDCHRPIYLSPIVNVCMHFLYHEDGVVNRSAFKALKQLASIAAKRACVEDATDLSWVKLLEGCLVPALRAGIGSRSSSTRRYFLLILRELVSNTTSSNIPNLHGDLAQFVNEEQSDLDFFVCMTHVQVHRRSRALQRLRKTVSDDSNAVRLTSQSLTLVLLPIALHSVYEATASEDSLAVEGVATVGTLCQLLSWSKYNNLLWTTLTQFHRHPESEAGLVALLCAVIDSFHFNVASECEPNSVLRSLESRFIPKIESLLTKEKVDKHGEKHKVIRSAIVLALVKLFKKLPEQTFKQKFPRLLTVICDALKSRESDARDSARKTLARIVEEVGLDYLREVAQALSVSLTKGYQLHVRVAALHTVLLKLASLKLEDCAKFNAALPIMLDLLQADLFGEAQDRKDADGASVRYVKEAAGAKSTHAYELIASMIRVKSTDSDSTIILMQQIVRPLVDRLKDESVSAGASSRIKDCLSRVVNGLQRNQAIDESHLFPFIMTTLRPYVVDQSQSLLASDDESSSDSEDDEENSQLTMSGEGRKRKRLIGAGKVVTWQPSILNHPVSAQKAHQVKQDEMLKERRVKDGFSAPKLTGSRRVHVSRPDDLNARAGTYIVGFVLQLLASILKGSRSFDTTTTDPFVPMLTACICSCRDSQVILLALRCISFLLQSDLPSLRVCASPLSAKSLDLLTSSGSSANQNPEILQSTFKLLTYLMKFDAKIKRNSKNAMQGDSDSDVKLPLDAEQMQILLRFLRSSLMDSDQHNPAVGLVKAIVARRYLSAEVYDVVETLLELTVRSHKASLRDQSRSIVVSFLIEYPLEPGRLKEILDQIALNLRYEIADGRLSAITLVASVIDRFPIKALVDHCEVFFLPLSIQLVNDDSDDCKRAVSKCITALLKRLPLESIQELYSFTERWEEGASLQIMVLQLHGHFIDNEEFMKRTKDVSSMLDKLETTMQECENNENNWEMGYFCLQNLEKLESRYPTQVHGRNELWSQVVQAMALGSHVWLRQVATRLVVNHITQLPPSTFLEGDVPSFLRDMPKALFEVARNLCFLLNAPDNQQSETMLPLLVKGMTWTVQAMDANPDQCYDASEDDNVNNPVTWVLTRLSNIAKPKGPKRRQSIFKCFAALVTSVPATTSTQQHLELLLYPLLRVSKEQQSEYHQTTIGGGASAPKDDQGQLAEEVLSLIEETASSELFLAAQASVHQRARDRKEKRKLEEKQEFVLDPTQAAQRKQDKHQREKKRRKRRVDERRRERGASAKARFT